MRKFLMTFVFLISFLSCDAVLAQTGDADTPYATNGWDAPEDYSTYYSLPIYRLLSNPGGWINIHTRKTDSLFNALVVSVDTTQLEIVNDSLRHSDDMSGMASFTTTAEVDTILVTGMDSLDIVILTIREAVAGANDPLSVNVEDGYFVARRAASGTSGLKYNWIWIRKY